MRVLKIVYTVEYTREDLCLLHLLLRGYRKKTLPHLMESEEAVLDAMYHGLLKTLDLKD